MLGVELGCRWDAGFGGRAEKRGAEMSQAEPKCTVKSRNVRFLGWAGLEARTWAQGGSAVSPAHPAQTLGFAPAEPWRRGDKRQALPKGLREFDKFGFFFFSNPCPPLEESTSCPKVRESLLSPVWVFVLSLRV